jgi:large subunit ribosomal protein L7/L12
MSTKRESIVHNLKVLNLIEISKLIKQVEKTFGVSAAALQTSVSLVKEPLIVQELIEEKNTFDIILIEAPSDKRISILKIVRNITGLGLKESKEIVDNVPKTIKEGVTKLDCDNIIKELESAGAKVNIK